MENELKQRGVSYEELALLDEAFREYTEGVTFRDEDAKAEAALEYQRGFIEYPEEAGDVEDYIAERVPYFAPGIVEAGEGIPTLKQAYDLVGDALAHIRRAEKAAGLAIVRANLNKGTAYKAILEAERAAERLKGIVESHLLNAGGHAYPANLQKPFKTWYDGGENNSDMQ